MCYDSTQNRTLLLQFGPQLGGPLGSLHAYDGTQWSLVSSAAPAPFSGVYGFVHDPVRDVFLYSDWNGILRQWDGANWTVTGNMPFVHQSHDLVWNPIRQRVVTAVTGGIWEWDGQTWTMLPNSGVPVSLSGAELAFDETRNVLLARWESATGGHTREWNGSLWQSATASPEVKPLYAPSMGGVIGLAANSGDTRRWNPTTRIWELGVFGGSPGTAPGLSSLAMAYDTARARAVVIAGAHGLHEYHSSATAPPTTWVVAQDGTGDFFSFQQALAAASAGDRILVSGNHGGHHTINKGLQIHGNPSASFAELDINPNPIWGPDRQRVSIHGCTTGLVTLTSGQLTMSGCSRIRGLWADFGNYSLHLQDCTVVPPLGFYDVDTLRCGGSGTVLLDGCTSSGQHGIPMPDFPNLPPFPGLYLYGSSRAVIVNSHLTGGTGVFGNGEVALRNHSTQPALVLGASQLIAGGPGSAISGSVLATSDVIMSPTGGTNLPAMSWIDAPPRVDLGQTLSVQATIQTGHSVLLAFGRRGEPEPIDGIRIPLWLSLDDPIVVIATLTASNSQFDVTIPIQPHLMGLETYWQGVAVGSQTFELTNPRSVLIE